MEAVQEDSSQTHLERVDWSVNSRDSYGEVYETAKTGAEMVEKMKRLHADVKAQDFASRWKTQLLFPKSSSDWLILVPGKPGDIFLNPDRGYDGDPARDN